MPGRPQVLAWISKELPGAPRSSHEAQRKLIRGAWETPGACLELPRSSEELSGSHQEKPLRVSVCSCN